jgi:hypothetical protein
MSIAAVSFRCENRRLFGLRFFPMSFASSPLPPPFCLFNFFALFHSSRQNLGTERNTAFRSLKVSTAIIPAREQLRTQQLTDQCEIASCAEESFARKVWV